MPWDFKPRFQLKRLSLLALAVSLCLSNATNINWAKSVQLESVSYQPQALALRTTGGLQAPNMETWPNIKDGLHTELIMLRLPQCEGDYAKLQHLALTALNTHPEIKQFWITPLNADKKHDRGVQIVLEVETTDSEPEFTPEVFSQGEQEWLISLQGSKEAKAQNLPANLPASTPEISQVQGNPFTTDEQPAAQTNLQAQAGQKSEPKDLLAALRQARQRQQELATQLAATQKELAESRNEQTLLKHKLDVYENLLQESGVNPDENGTDDRMNDKVVIQNLKSALAKVAQKLKTAEEALAARQNAPSANSSHSSKTAQPLQSVKKPAETDSPVAALSVLDENRPNKTTMTDLAAQPATRINLNANPPKLMVQTQPLSPNQDEVEISLRQAVQKNPIQVQHYLKLADYYLYRNDVSKAKAALMQLTHVEPGGAQGYYYLTMIYLSQKDLPNAQKAYQQYAHKNPGDASGISTLKKALANSGNTTGQSNPAAAQQQ